MSTLKYFVGIDPGSTGAVAVLGIDGRLTEVVDLPNAGPEPVAMDLAALLEAIGRSDELFLGVEMPFACLLSGVACPHAGDRLWDVILGVVGTLGLRHERVKPADWKRGLGLPMGKGLTSTRRSATAAFTRLVSGRTWRTGGNGPARMAGLSLL
jgi:hypothetical protein